MSQLVFLSVPPKSKVPVRASVYKCPTTHAQIVANECMVPMSPYAGKVMQRVTAKRIEVGASDIKDGKLKVVGSCTNCQHTLIASAKALESLANTKPHCIICGTAVQAADVASPRQKQLIPQALPTAEETEELDYGSNLHDDPEILHGDPKYKDVGLNKELLQPGSDQKMAQEILSAMDDEDDEGLDTDSEDGEDEGDGDDYEEGDGDDDGGDLGSNDYYDEDEDGDDEDGDDEDGDDDSVNEDEDDGEETTEAGPSEDDDESMDAVAAFDDEDTEDADYDHSDAPHVVGERDMTTMDPDLITQDTALRQVGISASDALHSVLSSESATMAVLPIDTSSAMILALVQDVGYMPYIALEASKATDTLKPLFANPGKLVDAVNTVLSNSTGDIAKDLAGFGVRQINYNVRASSLIEKRINDGITAATSALEDEKAHLIEDLKQCLAISATQVLKNLSDDATNVVSASLAESLKKVGVRSANAMIDDAFTQHGPELMKTIIAKALDLMNKPYDVRNEIAKYVTAATGRNVLAAPSTGDRVAKSLADGSLPLSSVQASAGNTVESAAIRNPVTASANGVDYSSIVKQAAGRRYTR